MKTFLLILTLVFFGKPSNGQVNKISGFYTNNFADLGFFGEKIQLNADLTFKYHWGGDLMSYDDVGIYSFIEDTLIFKYNYSPDDSVVIEKIDTIINKLKAINEFYHVVSDTIKTRHKELRKSVRNRPSRLYYKREKLHCIHNDGKVGCLGEGVSKYKRYFIFGEHYMTMRKYYLVKRGNVWRE